MNIFNKDTLDESIHNDTNRASLWSRVFLSEENQLYSDVVIKGLIWIVMFIVSFVALFIVFNDNFMKPKEIVVVNNKDQTDYYSTDTSSASSNGTNFSFNSYSNNSNTEISDSKDDELGLPKSSNTDTLPLNENSTTQAKNSNSLANNRESINNTNNTNSTKKTFSNPNINSLITNSINSNKVVNQSNNVHQSSNNILPSSSSSASNLVNKNAQPSSVNTAVKKADYSKAWLVVIYSGNKENLVKQKWQEFKKKYPSLFVNKKAYFIKIDIPKKGVYYRISLGDLNTNKALPYFSSNVEANNYCKYLVNNKLSCFIMETQKNVLGDLLFNQ